MIYDVIITSRFDTDHSGSLQRDEFAAMMQALMRNKMSALRLLMLTRGGRRALLHQVQLSWNAMSVSFDHHEVEII